MQRNAPPLLTAIKGAPLAAPTSPPRDDRPPYLAAAAVFLVVLTGYVITLAPSVTFWDAGEFIAAARILGIPHPPGTPLFVLIAHAWADLVRIGEYAYRTNLLSAVISAGAAALFFLMVAQSLRGWSAGPPKGRAAFDPIFVLGGAVAAAVCGAFVFTVWQNSNETEVYMVATFSIAAVCWLALLWRKHRGTPRAPHILLLIVYLGAVSLGNHLLALLVGPALIGFMAFVIRHAPLSDERERLVERAQLAVVTGIWALLIATGMGSTALLVLGGLVFLAAAAYAAGVSGAAESSVRAPLWLRLISGSQFTLSVLVLAAVGVSTYVFLYLRAGLDPFINEADPSTWESLLAVIRREQYPPRSPLDNPIYNSGPDNPGRSLAIIGLQLLNYLQYFDWQWANGLAPTDPVFARGTPLLPGLPIPARLPFTLLFTSLGVYGFQLLKRRDAGSFWLLFLLWLTTGLGLVAYINFKPGFSVGYDLFPDGNQHEVRERDYFYIVSFQVWGLMAGVGLAGVYRWVRGRFASAADRSGQLAAASVLGLALLPFALNFRAASRAHGPEAYLARDFAYDLLQTIEPYGIVFTNGDNDTFPLWYAQEVEGIRQDVAVVNLSLGNTDWYIRQLRDNPVRPFQPEQAPWFASLAAAEPPPPLHKLSDDQIATMQPQLLSRSHRFLAGRIDHTYPEGTPMYVKDILILRLLQENYRHRPVYFSITAGSNWLDLDPYLTQEALAIRIHATDAPDTSRLSPGLLGIPLDVPRTDSLTWQAYRYAGLREVDSLRLDPTSRNIGINLSIPPLSLGQAYQMRGDRERALRNFELAYKLSPDPNLRQLIGSLQLPDSVLFGDTAVGARR